MSLSFAIIIKRSIFAKDKYRYPLDKYFSSSPLKDEEQEWIFYAYGNTSFMV